MKPKSLAVTVLAITVIVLSLVVIRCKGDLNHKSKKIDSLKRDILKLKKYKKGRDVERKIVDEACRVKIRSNSEIGEDKIYVEGEYVGHTPENMKLHPDSVYSVRGVWGDSEESVRLDTCAVEDLHRNNMWINF